MQLNGNKNNEPGVMWYRNHLNGACGRFRDYFQVPANDPLEEFAAQNSGSHVLIAGGLDTVQLKLFRTEVHVVMSTLVLKQPLKCQEFLAPQRVFY